MKIAALFLAAMVVFMLVGATIAVMCIGIGYNVGRGAAYNSGIEDYWGGWVSESSSDSEPVS